MYFSSRGSNLDATDYDKNGVKLFQDGLPITTADGNSHNRMLDPLSARYAVIARGAYVANLAGCFGCHTNVTEKGPDMAKAFAGGLTVTADGDNDADASNNQDTVTDEESGALRVARRDDFPLASRWAATSAG